MDPRFQPQNPSPYPQNNPARPQTNPLYSQENLSGPNKYPTLPPVQNHISQPSPQSNQNPGRNPAYVPPNLYGNVQDGPSQDEENEGVRLAAEKAELEKDLGNGRIRCYIVWSFFIAVCSLLCVFKLLKIFPQNMEDAQSEQLIIGGVLFGFVWLFVQSLLAILSVAMKSLSVANVTCWVMKISLVAVGVLEVYCVLFLFFLNNGMHLDGAIFMGFTIVVIGVYIWIHVFVNMKAAVRIREILLERAKIEMKLIDNTFNNA